MIKIYGLFQIKVISIMAFGIVNRLAYIVCENKWQGEKGHIEINDYYTRTNYENYV
jgi:hypothetical protein